MNDIYIRFAMNLKNLLTGRLPDLFLSMLRLIRSGYEFLVYGKNTGPSRIGVSLTEAA